MILLKENWFSHAHVYALNARYIAYVCLQITNVFVSLYSMQHVAVCACSLVNFYQNPPASDRMCVSLLAAKPVHAVQHAHDWVTQLQQHPQPAHALPGKTHAKVASIFYASSSLSASSFLMPSLVLNINQASCEKVHFRPSFFYLAFNCTSFFSNLKQNITCTVAYAMSH